MGFVGSDFSAVETGDESLNKSSTSDVGWVLLTSGLLAPVFSEVDASSAAAGY